MSRFEQQLQALVPDEVPKGTGTHSTGGIQAPAPMPPSFIPDKVVDVPGIGSIGFPGNMTGSQIREAILRFASDEGFVVKPAWYWYASLIAVPLFASLAPLALYRVVQWVAEGFVHTGN